MSMLINSVSVVVDHSMAAFLCRKPASSAAAGDGCIAQARGKRFLLLSC